MKKTFSAIVMIVCMFGAKAQTVDTLRLPKVWFAADRSTVSGTKWTDLSLFGNHGLSTSTTTTPQSYQTINFNKALVFDGIDDHFKVPFSLEKTNELAVLAVFQTNDTTERGIWGSENQTQRVIVLTTRKAIGPDTIADAYGKFEKVALLNSLLQTWEKTPAVVSPASSMMIGNAGTGRSFQKFSGSLAELIVFDHALNFLDRVQFETYLAIKYGTGLKGGNFVSSNKDVLWRVTENNSYGKNIAGLGRDDHFNLYQKQSGSAYDSGLLVMSVGALAASNQANTSTINDRNFIIWGDNGLPLNTKAGTGADSIIQILQRKWLVTSTITSQSTLSTNLYLDASRLGAEPMGYWLVIDRTGSSNFSIDNLEYISPTRVDNGKLLFENIRWDVDGSGKDNFTLVRKRNLLIAVRKINDPLCSDPTAGEIRVDVIAGKPSYLYTLKSEDAAINRSWRNNESFSTQSDLIAGSYTISIEDNAQEKLVRQFSRVQPDRLIVNLGPDQRADGPVQIRLDAAKDIPAGQEVTYLWETSFGFQSTDKAITVSEPGVYRATVTRTSDGCTFSDQVAITGSDTERYSVYPTIIRSEETYYIGVSLPTESPVNVKVFNARGTLVQLMQSKNNAEYLFTTSVSEPGVYMIVIQTSRGVETRKIIAY